MALEMYITNFYEDFTRRSGWIHSVSRYKTVQDIHDLSALVKVFERKARALRHTHPTPHTLQAAL